MVRYSYGDWNWYALRRTGPAEGTAALLWPTHIAVKIGEGDLDPPAFGYKHQNHGTAQAHSGAVSPRVPIKCGRQPDRITMAEALRCSRPAVHTPGVPAGCRLSCR
jgi:hypothetical protein